MTDVELGRRIKSARDLAGLQQGTFGEPLGWSKQIVSAVEHGKRKVTFQEICRIAEITGVDLGFFRRPLEHLGRYLHAA